MRHLSPYPLLATLAVAAVALSTPALADVKAGVEAWSAGDYDTAIRDWKPLADAGDPDAQFNLAQAYKMGRGVPLDLDKAEELYGKAAAQGHVQAADTYGLLLFQRGERQRALPYIEASAKRGDPRAWYILGIAHFNGDILPKDWVRAYAYISLAQQAGLPQASRALTQMDSYIPLAQRQQSVPLASQIASSAESTRAQQLTSASLGTETLQPPGAQSRPAAAAAPPPKIAAAKPEAMDSPATAGADYARPRVAPSSSPQPKPGPVVAAVTPPEKPPLAKPAPKTTLRPEGSSQPKPAPRPASKPERTISGPWRIQFGAFAVASNVDALWDRLSKRPELAGHPKIASSSGRLTKLQAGGFASEAEASTACARLKSAGFATCVPTRD